MTGTLVESSNNPIYQPFEIYRRRREREREREIPTETERTTEKQTELEKTERAHNSGALLIACVSLSE